MDKLIFQKLLKYLLIALIIYILVKYLPMYITKDKLTDINICIIVFIVVLFYILFDHIFTQNNDCSNICNNLVKEPMDNISNNNLHLSDIINSTGKQNILSSEEDINEINDYIQEIIPLLNQIKDTSNSNIPIIQPMIQPVSLFPTLNSQNTTNIITQPPQTQPPQPTESIITPSSTQPNNSNNIQSGDSTIINKIMKTIIEKMKMNVDNNMINNNMTDNNMIDNKNINNISNINNINNINNEDKKKSVNEFKNLITTLIEKLDKSQEMKKTRYDDGIIANEMEYTDYHHLPLGDNINNGNFDYGYAFLPPEQWYPKQLRPPVCVTNQKHEVSPIYTIGTPIDVKEWNESRRVTPSDNINTVYIKDKLNSGR